MHKNRDSGRDKKNQNKRQKDTERRHSYVAHSCRLDTQIHPDKRSKEESEGQQCPGTKDRWFAVAGESHNVEQESK